MEDDLKKNGIRPQKKEKRKMTSTKIKMEDDLKKIKMEDDLKKMEDNLNFFVIIDTGRRPQ